MASPSANRTLVRVFGGRLFFLLLVGCLFELTFPQPVEAQMQRVIGGMGRSISGSWKRIVSDPQRFRIRPKLVIDPQRQTGAVVALSTDRSRRLVLALHGDGAAHLWDLERGVRIGGRFGDVVAGVVRSTGGSAEIVAVHRDGSVSALRLDGEYRSIGSAIPDFDARAIPSLSGDGHTMVARTLDHRWHVIRAGESLVTLPDAEDAAKAVLSPDGSIIVYRSIGGALTAGWLSESGMRAKAHLDGCGSGIPVTAAAFTPIGTRVVLGDAHGHLCVWTVLGADAPRRLFAVSAERLDGAVTSLAMNQDGTRVAASDSKGSVEVWTVSGNIERRTSAKLSSRSSRPLVLDTSRQWVFGGEANGSIAIHSLERKEPAVIGWLISTAQGWTVLDRVGRFDGSQSGIDALSWSGETETRIHQDLPVDAFSESYFEPGLLTKLSTPDRTDYLTAKVDDLSSDGYLRPPKVTIDPIPSGRRIAGETVSVTVRSTEADYPEKLLSEIRLYHNGKLVPDGRLAKTEGIGRFSVRLSEGHNDFRALGIGHRGIEGPLSPVQTVAVSAAPSPPVLRTVAIGINDYVRPAWELFYAHNDAQTLVSALRERSSSLFADVEAVTLLDASADKPSIEKRILEASSSPLDVLVVYFSGHGYAFHEQGKWEWYLLPFTTEWNRKASSQADHDAQIRQFGLSSRRLMQLLTRAQAQRVFLVLDSCRSGAVVGAFDALSGSDSSEFDDAVAQKSLRRLARVGGIHVLAASRAQEDATELQVVPHGALTYLVIEGIRGAADGAGNRNSDGQVSVREIVDYAALEMPTLAHRLVQEPISQIPVGYSRGTDFTLATQ